MDGMSSFRVVRIHKRQIQDTTNLELEIFSSDSWKWTQTIVSTKEQKPLYFSPIVSCNGILYWTYVDRANIFAYDPFTNTDHFRIITQPKDKDKYHGVKHSLGKRHGILSFTQCYASTLSIWELKDYSGLEWSLVHKVDLNTMKLDHRTIPAIHPIYGDLIYLHIRRTFVLCNMRTRTLKEVCSLIPYCTYPVVSPFVLPFWPTPVPVPLRQRNVLR
ncbi:uncharacterized protein LOC132281293 [Cornus florida]|uniref:uncharacterized protein LOC132281293 n=1 Tax=Cornus florida TaxID=4283 RepID=UPI00289B8D15|nr:uncharacterized protein LOC132281293 [Cornus florida]